MLLRLNSDKHSPDPVETALALAVQGIAGDATSRQAPGKAAELTRIQRLIKDKAWTDAAIALIALELPQWKLRRLTFEDGEWFCCLSMRLGCPLELDDMVEAHHAVLPLAIIQAALEAWGRGRDAPGNRIPRVPRPEIAHATCCDNFG